MRNDNTLQSQKVAVYAIGSHPFTEASLSSVHPAILVPTALRVSLDRETAPGTPGCCEGWQLAGLIIARRTIEHVQSTGASAWDALNVSSYLLLKQPLHFEDASALLV